MASGVAATRAANSSGSVTAAGAGAVSLKPTRIRFRSTASSSSTRAIGWSGSAVTLASTRRQRSTNASTVAASKTSVLNSAIPSTPAFSGPPRRVIMNDRSIRAVPVAAGTTSSCRPDMPSVTSVKFCHAIRTWVSGWCAIDRVGFSASTSTSNGRSWWSYASRLRLRTRASTSRNVGCPVRSTRSTSVLMKAPTSSSRATSVRPATAVPIGMSSPPPSRLSSTASAACTTMDSVAPLSRASSATRSATPASQWKPKLAPCLDATGGCGRSVGSGMRSGSPASAVRQYASCLPARLSGSFRSPSSRRCQIA